MKSPKRVLVVALSSVALLAAIPAAGQAATRQHVREYERAYHAVAQKFGHRTPGRDIVRWGSRSHGRATDRQVTASLAVLHRMLAPPPLAPAPVAITTSTSVASSGYSSAPAVSSGGGGYGDVPGVPSGFASCVAMRESTNGAGSSNIYGIQGGGGGGSLAEQKQAFAQMYAARGTQPWAPYDGC